MLEENYLKTLGLPTKTEIDEIIREVYLLKKQVKELTGRIREISGGGIGRETALLFAKEGAKVAIAGRTLEKLVEVCREIYEMNEFGRIDILINNAGVNKDALVTKMTKEQWNGIIEVDLTGAFNCIQAVADIMINQGSGVIINASSVSGKDHYNDERKNSASQACPTDRYRICISIHGLLMKRGM